MLARQYRMPAVDLTRFEVDPRIAKLIPAELAMKHLVLPLKRDGRTLTVAMADPTNLGVIEDLKFITRYDIFPVIAGEFTLRNVDREASTSARTTQRRRRCSSDIDDDDERRRGRRGAGRGCRAAALAAQSTTRRSSS